MAKQETMSEKAAFRLGYEAGMAGKTFGHILRTVPKERQKNFMMGVAAATKEIERRQREAKYRAK